MIVILVALLVTLAIAGFSYMLLGSAGTAIEKYDTQLNTVANTRLEEMFIFVDPSQLRRISIIFFVLIAIISYAIFRSPIVTLVLALSVAFMPNLIANFLKQRRLNRFNMDLPDALQSTANMLKSGLNLVGALEFIVEDGRGPIPQEFGLFLRELKIGVPFNEALDGMYKRMPLPDFQLVVAGMKISREIGGSLAEVLARLADTIRKRIEMEGKIDSLTSMGRLQGVVMTLLPIGVGYAIYKIEPEAMSKLFTHWTGWICCAVVLILEGCGYWMIQKIVDIDV